MRASTVLDIDLDGPPVEIEISDGDFMDNPYLLISTNVSEDILIKVQNDQLILEAIDIKLGKQEIVLAGPEDFGLWGFEVTVE